MQSLPTETHVVAEVGVVLLAVYVLWGASPELHEFWTGGSSNGLHKGSRTNLRRMVATRDITPDAGPSSGRHTKGPLKVPRHMALIGKIARGCSVH